ncbi:hypothetical protein [Kineosporia succinea]|uniref:Uncharacterized protein n=1 Tax=Kineosporia succinea TaxID=84632 RepID=A0ABT9P4I1_9ACTN|nr:hypothetical protein [Kineosporia succinea]MDP9826970.1 hypothetical protein [Kineosporia succinea]
MTATAIPVQRTEGAQATVPTAPAGAVEENGTDASTIEPTHASPEPASPAPRSPDAEPGENGLNGTAPAAGRPDPDPDETPEPVTAA